LALWFERQTMQFEEILLTCTAASSAASSAAKLVPTVTATQHPVVQPTAAPSSFLDAIPEIEF